MECPSKFYSLLVATATISSWTLMSSPFIHERREIPLKLSCLNHPSNQHEISMQASTAHNEDYLPSKFCCVSISKCCPTKTTHAYFLPQPQQHTCQKKGKTGKAKETQKTTSTIMVICKERNVCIPLQMKT